MHNEDLVDGLASSSLFVDVPRADLEWLVSHGEVVTYAADPIVRSTGTPIEEMSIILEGRVGLYAEKAGVRRKVSDAGPDYVLGVMPYSSIVCITWVFP